MTNEQNRFYNHKWGVFNHYLAVIQNNKDLPNSQGKETDWDALVNEFDTELLAKNLHEMGANYYVITLMQGTKYMVAPNESFDKIANTKPGEACSTRDLILDISNSLKKYNIDLFLYYTGDGPYKNKDIGEKFGFLGGEGASVHLDFVEKWASVLEEYSKRYGERISGWWIDGCYDFIGYTKELRTILYNAAKSGNKNTLVALNGGLSRDLFSSYEYEDFICGEREDFDVLPSGRLVGNAQAHILIPIGTASSGIGASWGSFGLSKDKEFIAGYVEKVHNLGGVVSFDIGVYRNGDFCQEHKEALGFVGQMTGTKKQ